MPLMGAFRNRQLTKISRWLTLLRRRQSDATFIGITGSSGKTTTAALLSHILSCQASVHSQVGNNALVSCVATIKSLSPAHRYVVCELGSEGPGTLQPMIELIQPSVAIATLVCLEHYSAFRGLAEVAEEKRKLIEALPKTGLAILNHDDPLVFAMASCTQARVATFGRTGGEYRTACIEAPAPGRLTLAIIHDGVSFGLNTRFTGAHNSLAVAAAFTCAHQLGIPGALIAEKIASFEPIFGRCSAHFVPNGPIFIADTAKAPYHSIYLPVGMMAGFEAPRKRVVIGQISDYAGNNYSKYRDVHRASQAVADQVIFVGDNAHRSRASREDIAAQRFIELRTVEEAARFIRETAIPGEIILLKSAPNVHLERVLLSFQEEVRCWAHKCGKKKQCLECGRYSVPYSRHGEIKRRLAQRGFVQLGRSFDDKVELSTE
jgi:UDP-N-acetylmuramoyl-tripeptide--D-alanyl-D-alanine ligase